jgi:hypothetical protein
MANPHALTAGHSYWTADPFQAMSVAAKMGRLVGRYPSGQYIPGMVADGMSSAAKNNWFGYGVLSPMGGFTLINWGNT